VRIVEEFSGMALHAEPPVEILMERNGNS